MLLYEWLTLFSVVCAAFAKTETRVERCDENCDCTKDKPLGWSIRTDSDEVLSNLTTRDTLTTVRSPAVTSDGEKYISVKSVREKISAGTSLSSVNIGKPVLTNETVGTSEPFVRFVKITQNIKRQENSKTRWFDIDSRRCSPIMSDIPHLGTNISQIFEYTGNDTLILSDLRNDRNNTIETVSSVLKETEIFEDVFQHKVDRVDRRKQIETQRGDYLNVKFENNIPTKTITETNKTRIVESGRIEKDTIIVQINETVSQDTHTLLENFFDGGVKLRFKETHGYNKKLEAKFKMERSRLITIGYHYGSWESKNDVPTEFATEVIMTVTKINDVYHIERNTSQISFDGGDPLYEYAPGTPQIEERCNSTLSTLRTRESTEDEDVMKLSRIDILVIDSFDPPSNDLNVFESFIPKIVANDLRILFDVSPENY